MKGGASQPVSSERASASPTLALPKGGGAIRSIGEKFGSNPVTGTASFSIPIATSPGRGDFGPKLSLSYDSGRGNGVFGLGWDLSVPSITRKTAQGLPRYQDAEESDDFILSDAEDLVPELATPTTRFSDSGSVPGYTIRRYRPRIDGLYARIERWTRDADGDVHWRSLSGDNMLSIYGLDGESRIADPANPAHIFSWLLCETRDDRGNVMQHRYKADDGAGIDPAKASERNRGTVADPRRAVNRYLKRILYGNRRPLLTAAGERPDFLSDLPPADLQAAAWMFETVFDYGEHDPDAPIASEQASWTLRSDPFATYRSGFEVRTTRLCRRVLMFHHIPAIPGGDEGYDGVVRSTELTYMRDISPPDAALPDYAMLASAVESGWRRLPNGGYVRRPAVPVEFTYSLPKVDDSVHVLDEDSAENLPIGIDGLRYRWVDLHGEGIAGAFSEAGNGWFYKRNLSPLADGAVMLGPVEQVAKKPAMSLAGNTLQFMDLAGDGLPDLVTMRGGGGGFFEHDGAEGWERFRPFVAQLHEPLGDAYARYIDLTGDGTPDLLITRDDRLVWYEGLGENGFARARSIGGPTDDENGPRLIFADPEETIFVADMSGDGLSDIVRIRNGAVCYWPNLGYGRFEAKVSMDGSPQFDRGDQFDPARVVLADIDGSGTTDIIYLHGDGARLFFNLSGNGWSNARLLTVAPPVDGVSAVAVADLLGNGTACLVWSSPLPAAGRAPVRYMRLMGDTKPHLLIGFANNLGLETRIDYAPSTKFYLADRRAGQPWLSRLPFPVHVVERVETRDRIGRSRFVTRYAYHHGLFDGVEREFRGFAMVEQWDADELAPTSGTTAFDNEDGAWFLPAVHTKTWYHTGAWFGRDATSAFFAGIGGTPMRDAYYREPGLSDAQAQAMLLPDTVLPAGLSIAEEREAVRALKGMMLRQEVYALDGTAREPHPYLVKEQNALVVMAQGRGINRYCVFTSAANESLLYQYERNPTDPRVSHVLTLEVDAFGNVLKDIAISYGRRSPDMGLPLPADRARQTARSTVYAEHLYTAPLATAGVRRNPMKCETRSYELTGYAPSGQGGRFRPFDLVSTGPGGIAHIFDGEVDYAAAPGAGRIRRLIEHMRTLYRRDDLTALLPLGQVQPRALTGESYKLVYTPALVARIFQRDSLPLLPNPATVLGGAGGAGGGYVPSEALKADGRFPASDPDGHWWVASGRVFFSPDPAHAPAAEFAYARQHFFLPLRTRNAFHTAAVPTESLIFYDPYDLLPIETRDALGNRTTIGSRRADGTPAPGFPGNDYRLLQARCLSDPNRNRTGVAFDTLGMIVGSALMGKVEESLGDDLTGFAPDLTPAQVAAHATDPLAAPAMLLGGATTRLVYDLFAYYRTRGQPDPDPAAIYSITRETHEADLLAGAAPAIQHSVDYSDGFGRVIQRRTRVEPGPVSPSGPDVAARWVATGWSIFDNKGNAVREYEPFFSASHRFAFGITTGVSTIHFYDPQARVVARLRPNATYEKMLFTPWSEVAFDANDTVLLDPRTDPDVAGMVAGYFADPALAGWQTWFAERQGGGLGAIEQATALKAVAHADTPALTHMDMLGRKFLIIADNGPDPAQAAGKLLFASRVEHDAEGNERVVRDPIVHGGDAAGRIVATYDYDMAGSRVHTVDMDAGARWKLDDAAGNVLRVWDDRGQAFRTEYDPLRRPLRTFATNIDPANPGQTVITDRMVYGEQHPDAEVQNLRGAMHLHLDQAGTARIDARDFKGNTLRATRHLVGGTRYRAVIDWSVVDANVAALPADAMAPLDPVALTTALGPFLEADGYESVHAYDAMNRITGMVTPHRPDMQPSIVRPGYNEANLIERIDVNLRGANAAGQPVWTSFVSNIDYDAKGQRQRIAYGNGVVTSYDYDPLTFRMTRLVSMRDPALFPDDCPQPSVPGWPGCRIQSLRYSYDPVGNVCTIRDEAQQRIFFANQRVEPSNDYRYDALYRLVEASGREHLGQALTPMPHNHDDLQRMRIAHPGDGLAMGTYVETYVYDAVGNFLEMRHGGSNPANPGWTRSYSYAEASRIENGIGGMPLKPGNRLTASTTGGAVAGESYSYDEHGNMVRMPHLGGAGQPNMQWDESDRLKRVDLGGGGTSYNVYDAGGQRIRKVWEKPGNIVEERLYLGGCEIFRRRQGATRLERETLHVMDGTRRIALVETRTVDTAGTDAAPAQAIRYQLSNHLGSAMLELDDSAQIIAYEEFTPYGSTVYQAVRSQTETPRRYRFHGKERDEGTGFYYHGARYYAPWLARWISCDPAGLVDGPCLYMFVRGNPVGGADPSGKQTEPPNMGEVFDAILDVLEKGGPFTAQGEKGMRAIKITMDIDEALPVGAKGISAAEARARALDVNNRQFLDSATNRLTKWLGIDARSSAATGKGLSVANDANVLINNKFGDISEMRAIFDEAVGKIKNPGKMSPTKLKNAINGHMWDIIKTGASDDAVKVREALGKLGFQNIKGEGFVMRVMQEGSTVSKVANTIAKTAAPIIAKAEPLIAKAAPIVAKAAPVVKAVASPLIKIAGPAAIGISVVEFATAKNTEGRVNAGIGIASGALMMSKNPITVSAGAGLMAGQLIDKATNASTHSADAGIYVYEGLKDTWVGDTGAFVVGGAVSVLAIPSAIGYGIAERVSGWFD